MRGTGTYERDPPIYDLPVWRIDVISPPIYTDIYHGVWTNGRKNKLVGEFAGGNVCFHIHPVSNCKITRAGSHMCVMRSLVPILLHAEIIPGQSRAP
jgi:hypothetical protein